MPIELINKWFENYDKWVHQAERAERLGLDWEQEDKLLNVIYRSLEELDRKAEEMKAKHKEAKAQILEIRKRGGTQW